MKILINSASVLTLVLSGHNSVAHLFYLYLDQVDSAQNFLRSDALESKIFIIIRKFSTGAKLVKNFEFEREPG